MTTSDVQKYKAWLYGINEALLEYLKNNDISNREIMKELGFSDSSWYRRMENPEFWIGEELIKICELTGYSIAFRNQYLEQLFQLRKQISDTGLMVNKVAEKIGLSRQQFWRKLKSPERFDLNDIEVIVSYLEKVESL